MPAPKRPNTAAATEAVRRRGQESMAAKLREAGWLVVPPEKQMVERIRSVWPDPMGEWSAEQAAAARAVKEVIYSLLDESLVTDRITA
jgi:hypothetical protein